MSTQGVKQGCPLSTELFGHFIEALADFSDVLDARKREHLRDAPKVYGRRVSMVQYADDLSLFANSIDRMRVLLKRVDAFCAAFGMKVNVTKCEGMVFAPQGQRVRAFMEHLENSPFRLCRTLPWPVRSAVRQACSTLDLFLCTWLHAALAKPPWPAPPTYRALLRALRLPLCAVRQRGYSSPGAKDMHGVVATGLTGPGTSRFNASWADLVLQGARTPAMEDMITSQVDQDR